LGDIKYSNFDPERAKPVLIDARKCVRGLGKAQTIVVRNDYILSEDFAAVFNFAVNELRNR
jgi:hypothetical protein